VSPGDGPPQSDAPEEENASDEQQDELLDKILESELRYYRVESQFADDVEKWLEEKAPPRGEEPS